MACKILDMSPIAAAAVRSGTTLVGLETGSFMCMRHPKNLSALQECEQILYSRGCVPCSLAVLDGRLKVGLLPEELEAVCQAGRTVSRGELPGLIAAGGTAALRPSAALAAARLAELDVVVVMTLTDALADMDSLGSAHRLVFCAALPQTVTMLYASRGIPVLRQDTDTLVSAYSIMRELETQECVVAPSGRTLKEIVGAAADAAVLLKRLQTR